MNSLLTLTFAALLSSALLLGAMCFFSLVTAPLVFAKLPAETAGKFIRQVFPWYYGVGTVLAFAATVTSSWTIPGLLLGLVGFAFLFELVWLMPTINRNSDRAKEGDLAAQGTFDTLHRASVALNFLQIAGVLVAFALLAIRL